MSLIGTQSRRILGLNRLIISYRCSSNSKDDDKSKLHSVLTDLKNNEKLHKKPAKPLELKAKPTKKNIETSSSSESSSSSSSDEEISPELSSAVKTVADSMAKSVQGTEDDKQAVKVKTETDLMQTLKRLTTDTKNAKAASQVDGSKPAAAFDLSQLKIQKSEEKRPFVKGLKTEKREKLDFKSRPELTPEQKEFLEKRRKMRSDALAKQLMDDYQPTNLFESSKALGIFSQTPSEETKPFLKAWKTFEERELRIWQTQPPRNLLEDMAQMTDKGILWHFPINNEQGLDEDEVRASAIVYFSKNP